MSKEKQSSWLFGLEKFYEFLEDHDKRDFVKNIIRIIHSSDKDKAWALKRCFTTDFEKYPAESRDGRLSIYVDTMNMGEISHNNLFWLMTTIWGDEFINKLHLLFNNSDLTVADDLFSKSQVLSKIWMAETLYKLTHDLDNIVIFGGWYAQHVWYLKKVGYKHVYNIDLDGETLQKSQFIMDMDNYKAYVGNVNDVVDAEGNITLGGKQIDASLIINTSAEHMSTEWYDKLVPGQFVLIQTNDMRDMEGHVGCVDSLEDAKKKYPMRRVLFSGELALSNGKRFMLIGMK